MYTFSSNLVDNFSFGRSYALAELRPHMDKTFMRLDTAKAAFQEVEYLESLPCPPRGRIGSLRMYSTNLFAEYAAHMLIYCALTADALGADLATELQKEWKNPHTYYATAYEDLQKFRNLAQNLHLRAVAFLASNLIDEVEELGGDLVSMAVNFSPNSPDLKGHPLELPQ